MYGIIRAYIDKVETTKFVCHTHTIFSIKTMSSCCFFSSQEPVYLSSLPVEFEHTKKIILYNSMVARFSICSFYLRVYFSFDIQIVSPNGRDKF